MAGFVFKAYVPDHSANRMGHEGDVVNARKVYLSGTNKNLEHLLRNRFLWMNEFVSRVDNGVELGAGIGASRDFLNVQSLILTDFLDSDWLDKKNIDALNTGLDSGSFDFVVASNMIHHLAFPKNFFDECYRILKPGGKLIIQEIHSSLLMRFILRLMRHEGFDETTNVFIHDKPCNLVNDPWSANCSVPKLLFRSHKNFERVFPDWRVIHDRKVEFFQFLNSGGVIAKTFYIPLSPKVLLFQDKVDQVLISLLPDFFALQRQIVLEKAASHN